MRRPDRLGTHNKLKGALVVLIEIFVVLAIVAVALYIVRHVIA